MSAPPPNQQESVNTNATLQPVAVAGRRHAKCRGRSEATGEHSPDSEAAWSQREEALAEVAQQNEAAMVEQAAALEAAVQREAEFEE